MRAFVEKRSVLGWNKSTDIFIMNKWFGFHSWYLFEQYFHSFMRFFQTFIIVMKEFKPNMLAVLYCGTLFNQSGWLFSLISYFICLLEYIIQYKPTWCYFIFNTDLVLISLTVLTFKSKPVLLSQFLYLINMDSTFFSSSLCLY